MPFRIIQEKVFEYLSSYSVVWSKRLNFIWISIVYYSGSHSVCRVSPVASFRTFRNK